MKTARSLKRKAVRLKVDARAKLLLGRDAVAELRLRDVSMRGVCGSTSEPLEIDRQVEIQLDSPTVLVPVRKQARVTWVRRNADNTLEAGFSIHHLDLDNFTRDVFRSHSDPSDAASMYSVGNIQMGVPEAAPLVSSRQQKEEEQVIIEDASAKGTPWYLKAVIVIAVLAAAGYYTRNLPFMKPVVAAAGEFRTTLARKIKDMRKQMFLTVDGVVYDPTGKNNAVIIGGQMLQEGDSVNDLTVIKIHRDSVVVEKDGKVKTISLLPESS